MIAPASAASWSLLASAMLTSGCVVVHAPETIEELVVFAFVHFDEDEAYLRATGDNLLPLAEQHLEELREGYYVDLLDIEDLDSAGIDSPDVEGIIGALGAADYRHGLDDVLWINTHPDKAEIYDSVVSYQASDEDGERDCFLERNCRSYSYTVNEVVSAPIVGDATQRYRREFRWVMLSDGMEVLFSRALNPDGIELSTEIIEVDQQYSVYCMYPTGGIGRRLESFWVDARFLGAEVPEAFAVDRAVSEMQDSADRTSDLLDELL